MSWTRDLEDEATAFADYYARAKQELENDGGWGSSVSDEEIKNLAATYALGRECDFETYQDIIKDAALDIAYGTLDGYVSEAEAIVFARSKNTFPKESVSVAEFVPKYVRSEADIVASQHENEFSQYKFLVFDKLNEYTSSWKLSLFGHHHNKRAETIKSAVFGAKTVDDVEVILLNQKSLFESGFVINDTSQLKNKYFYEIKNKPKNVNTSGYYKSIVSALEIVKPISSQKFKPGNT